MAVGTPGHRSPAGKGTAAAREGWISRAHHRESTRLLPVGLSGQSPPPGELPNAAHSGARLAGLCSAAQGCVCVCVCVREM